MGDVGYEGTYSPMVVEGGTLNDLRNLAGQPPSLGKHWVMVDLNTGQFKWYMAKKRRSYGGYQRSYGGRRRY